jgi:hypothetical protein
MPRQQRTPYIRQKLPTFQATQANNILWTVISTSAADLEIRLTGPLNGLTINGVPNIVPQNGSAVPVSCSIISIDPAGLFAIIRLSFDVALEPADLYTLAAPSPAIANAFGGLLSAAQQAFPTPFIYANDIFPDLFSWAGTLLEVSFLSNFLPVCIGEGWSVYNSTQGTFGTFGAWVGGNAQVFFPIALNPGDQIEFTAGDPACKNGFGGTQIANSFVLP